MGIQINGATDSITAIDGTIDVVSAIGNAGVLTATAFVGNITGNVTGNINHASNLELQTGGVTRAHFNSSGHFGIVGITTFSDNVNISSNKKLTFNNPGLEIYHNNSNAYLDNNVGHFYIRNDVDGDTNSNIYIQAKSGENGVSVGNDGSVVLFYNNNSKLQTTNTGTYTTGIGTFTDKISVTGSQNSMLTNNQLIFDRAGTSYIDNSNNSGSLSFRIGSSYAVGLFIDSSANVSIPSKLMHHGDTDTFMEFGTNTITFDTGGSERLHIDSNGRVLLGTVRTYGTGPYYDDICINNSNGSSSAGGAGIDLISKSDNYGALVFSNESQHERGYVKFEHNSGVNKMRFGTLGTDRWTIISDGHFIPATDNSYDIGSNSLKVRNVSIAGTMTSGRATITGTTTAVRNSGVSTATGSIIYNSSFNALEVYTGSIWKVIQTKLSNIGISYLVVGGGAAGGGYYRGGGGGAGALRTNWNNESQGGGQSSAAAKTIIIGTAFSIIVGAGGAGAYNANGNAGGTTTFDDIVSNGGTGGARYTTAAPTNSGNGSGGGGGGHTGVTHAGGAGGTYGYAGGAGSGTSNQCGGGGGGAAAVGQPGGNGGTDGDGGAALANTITGSSVDYAGGAGGGNYGNGNVTIGGGAGAQGGGVGAGGAPGINASIANRGSGGSGAGGDNVSGGNGSAGVIVLRFSSFYTATVTGGVTSSTASVGSDTVLTITATSDSSQTVTFS